MGLVGALVAVIVMVLSLAGVLPRVLFFVAAAGLIVVAYKLDKRFKANAPPQAATPPLPTSPLVPPAAQTPTAPSAGPASAPPSLLPAGDLQAEHARLTQELTDRVDDDEDVRFDKFMRLRAIEQELSQQTPQPPT
jgi:hypothetical protein